MKTNNKRDLENRITFYLGYLNINPDHKDAVLDILKELRQELRNIKLKKITKRNEKEIPSDDGN
jgi:hypothetical protein